MPTIYSLVMIRVNLTIHHPTIPIGVMKSGDRYMSNMTRYSQ